MAKTAINDGQLLRITKSMPLGRARAFVNMLLGNHRMPVADPVVKTRGRQAHVEFRPTGKLALKLFNEEQDKRAERAVNVQSYRWRRIGPQIWLCEGREPHQKYRQDLVNGRCSCPDYHRVSKISCKCKHLICAEEAERRYQERQAKLQESEEGRRH